MLERVKKVLKGPHGDSRHHLTLEALEKGLDALPPAPRDRGTLSLIVARREKEVRETPERCRLTRDGGVPGDAWERDPRRKPDAALAVMRADVARLIANGQEPTLFGDNLFVDLDLSDENLPPGSRLRVGGALLEVTPEPHDGCIKFRQRFGGDALRFTAQHRSLHLRGIYLRVVEAAEVGVGDPVEVLSRGGSPG